MLRLFAYEKDLIIAAFGTLICVTSCGSLSTVALRAYELYDQSLSKKVYTSAQLLLIPQLNL